MDNSHVPAVLADGTTPLSVAALLCMLDELGVAHSTVSHPPLFTVEQSKALRGELQGAHTKNLFLRNKKGTMWLVTCREDCQIDLKRLGADLGAGRLSFCSPERLMKFLGVTPGAVSPFAVVNDRTGSVQVVLDRRLLQQDPLNLHPLDNTRTTAVSGADLLRLLDAVEHTPLVLDLDAQVDGGTAAAPAR